MSQHLNKQATFCVAEHSFARCFGKIDLDKVVSNHANRPKKGNDVGDEGFFFFTEKSEVNEEKAEVDGSSVMSDDSAKDREEGLVTLHQSAGVTPFLQPQSSLIVLPLH